MVEIEKELSKSLEYEHLTVSATLISKQVLFLVLEWPNQIRENVCFQATLTPKEEFYVYGYLGKCAVAYTDKSMGGFYMKTRNWTWFFRRDLTLVGQLEEGETMLCSEDFLHRKVQCAKNSVGTVGTLSGVDSGRYMWGRVSKLWEPSLCQILKFSFCTFLSE